MIKFDDHSVILNPLSLTTIDSFTKMGRAQTTIYNIRMMQLVEMADSPEIKATQDRYHYQRMALYGEAEKSYHQGSYLLRKNGKSTDRYEGSVIVDKINIKDGDFGTYAKDAVTVLEFPELGQFTISEIVRNDTIDLLKGIAHHQRKDVTNIRSHDDHTVISDHKVRFELVRPSSASNVFLLRIRNLK